MSSSFKHFNYHHFDCHLPLSLWFQMTFHALLLIYSHSRYSWEEKDQELLCGQNCTFSLALLPSFNRKTDTLYFLIIVLFANHLYYRSWPYRRKHRKTKGTRCCSGSQNSFTRWEERVSSDLRIPWIMIYLTFFEFQLAYLDCTISARIAPFPTNSSTWWWWTCSGPPLRTSLPAARETLTSRQSWWSPSSSSSVSRRCTRSA